MRLEATVPDSRASAVVELAAELGLSRSQIIDEALSLFLKSVIEVRRGRRLFTVDPSNAGSICELATPTLTALEWALRPQTVELSEEALATLQERMAAPAQSSPRLAEAARRHRR